MGEDKRMEWKIGDFCRTVFLDDGLEYEGIVESVDVTEENKKYVNVKFLGYGNFQTCWIEEIWESKGLEARQTQEKESQGEEKTCESSKKKDWKVGDKCRALFIEDGIEYEADITTLEKDGNGREYAELTFIGYLNVQTVWMEEILESKGQEARKRQMIESGAETGEVPNCSGDGKAQINYVIGDYCRIVYSKDSKEYEGKVTSLEKDEGGRSYATVRISGYGIEDTVWYDQLMTSKGSEARKSQRKEAKDKDIKDKDVKERVLKENCEKEVKDNEQVESVVVKEKTIIEPVKQEAVLIEKPEKVVVENTTPIKEDSGHKKPDTPIPHNFKKGDHVRTTYSADGLEYEGKLESIDKDDEGREYVTVVFWGYLNEETVWIDELMPSHGPQSIAAQEKAAASLTNNNNNNIEASIEPTKTTLSCEPNETDDSSVTITSSINDEIKVKLYFAEKLEKCNQEIESLENKVTLLNKENETLMQQVSDKNGSGSQDSLELRKSREKIQELTAKVTDLEQKNQNFNATIQSLKDEHNNKYTKLKGDNIIFDKKNGELKMHQRKAEETIKELSVKIKNLEANNKQLVESKKNVDNNGNVATATFDQYRILSEKYSEMEIMLSKSTADSKVLITKVEQLRAENSKLKEDKQELIDELDQYAESGAGDSSTISVEEIRPMRSPLNDRSLMISSMMPSSGGASNGDFQPVLCYLPTIQPQSHRQFPPINATVQPNVARTTLFSSNSSIPSDNIGINRRTLRRPKSSTLTPTTPTATLETTTGKLSIVCKGAAGVEKLVKELSSSGIEKSRINFIFEELKSELLNLMLDDCGHKVILTLMKVGTDSHHFAIMRTIWENPEKLAKTHGGVELILESMSVKPMTMTFKSIMQKFVIHNDLKFFMQHQHAHRVVVEIINLIKPKQLIDAIDNHLEDLWASEYGTAVIKAAIINYVHDDIKIIMQKLIDKCNIIEQHTHGLSIIDEIFTKHVSTKNIDDDCIKTLFAKVSPYAWIFLSKNLSKTPEGISLLKIYNIL